MSTEKLANSWPCVATSSHSLHIRRANGSFPLSLYIDHPEHSKLHCHVHLLYRGAVCSACQHSLSSLNALLSSPWVASHCLVLHQPSALVTHHWTEEDTGPIHSTVPHCCKSHFSADDSKICISIPSLSLQVHFCPMVHWTETSTRCVPGNNSCNQSQHNISFSFSS